MFYPDNQWSMRGSMWEFNKNSNCSKLGKPIFSDYIKPHHLYFIRTEFSINEDPEEGLMIKYFWWYLNVKNGN